MSQVKDTSKMPTLYRPGYLTIQEWFSEKEKQMSGMEYFIEHLKKIDSVNGNYEPQGPGDRVILLRAGTGSGKSTSVPPEILEYVLNGKSSIICGEPTVIVTKEKVFDILEQKGAIFQKLKLGENIGYSTGNDKLRISKPGIIYATHGTIRQILLSSTADQVMKKYRYIIVDEFHQRTLDIEQILISMKKLIEENWKAKNCSFLICMSATFEPKEFVNFFNVPPKNFIDVKGTQNFPLEKIYPKLPITNLVEYISGVIKDIHINNIDDINGSYRDIIVFGPNDALLKKLSLKINELNKIFFDTSFGELIKKLGIDKKFNVDLNKKYFLSSIIFTGSSYKEGSVDYKKFMTDIKNINELVTIGNVTHRVTPSRKVYLATNAAETGVTFQGLKYCVDTGLELYVSALNDLHCGFMLVKDESVFSLRQRMGRVGRTAPGVWYPCFTKELEDQLEIQKMPNIVTGDQFQQFLISLIIEHSKVKIDYAYETDVTISNINSGYIFKKFSNDNNNWFKLFVNNIIEISKIQFLTIPPYDYFNSTLKLLLMYGYIDYNYAPTLYALLNKSQSKLNIFNFKMILMGYFYGINIIDLITIACTFTGRNVPFEMGYRYRNPLQLPKLEAIFYSTYVFMDDFIEIIFLFDEIKELISKHLRHNKMLVSFFNNINVLSELEKWCEQNKVNYKKILAILELREEIINKFVDDGINPFYNRFDDKNYSLSEMLRKNIVDGLAEIRKYKHCIYEGYKYYLCILKDNDYYMINNSLKIAVTSKICMSKKISDQLQTKPKFIVVHNPVMMLMKTKEGNVFTLTTKYVSALDCYVNVDLAFNKN